MNEFNELEFKYNADNVGLKDFQSLMDKLKYKFSKETSSWDYYFVNNNKDFIRFRDSEQPELTIKRKTTEANSWVRKEVDVPLDSNKVDLKTITEFAKLEGYNLNFKLFKSCFIFIQEFVNYVYYITYDEQLKETGRFIEVEINKDKLPFTAYDRLYSVDSSITGPMTPQELLRVKETELNGLGITYKNRMKKNLFEMFYKE